MRKIIWLLPPMASALVPNQPSTLGWGGVTLISTDVELIGAQLLADRGSTTFAATLRPP
jgi:hypothetical protein